MYIFLCFWKSLYPFQVEGHRHENKGEQKEHIEKGGENQGSQSLKDDERYDELLTDPSELFKPRGKRIRRISASH